MLIVTSANLESTASSGNSDFCDGCDGGAFGDVGRQQPERVDVGAGVHRPPDRVPSGAARGHGRSVAQRAVMSLE